MTLPHGPGTAADFWDGHAAGWDPQPETEEDSAGDVITHAASWWNTRTCATCGHTFRRGDRVRVDAARRTVGHLDVALHCVGATTARPASEDRDAGTADFMTGVLAQFPVLGNLPVVATDEVPGLLSPPDRGFARNGCLVCGHTFRPNEYVVICPCRPTTPGCRAAVHRDPVRGLVCRENWRAGTAVRTCPITLLQVLP